jgi:hypothetical protein
MSRCVSLWTLPAELIFWAAMHSSSLHQARVELGLLSVDDTSKDGTEEFKERHTKIFLSNLHLTLGKGMGWFRNNISQFGTGELKKFIWREIMSTQPPFSQKILADGVEAIMGTMLMSTYAAFETMAIDLWEAALNRHDELAHEYIKKHVKNATTGDDLLRYGFNLQGKMGSVLLRKERV